MRSMIEDLKTEMGSVHKEIMDKVENQPKTYKLKTNIKTFNFKAQNR